MSTDLAIITPAELLSAYDLAEVLQISRQAVRKKLKDAPREKDADGLIVWRENILPQEWRHRLDLAKRIKGCDSVAELICSRRFVASHFEFTIDQATDHEKILWPARKVAILEYYRVVDFDGHKGNAKRRACARFEELTHQPVDARTMHRWIAPVEKCGGPQHAPDEAYVLWGKRRTLEGVPRETVEYFNELVSQNQRKLAPAWKKLVLRLKNWRETGDNQYRIPGYPTPPLNAPGKNLPLRWSYKYFIDPMRRPPKPVIEGARYGLSEIKSLASIVRKTRFGLKVGEIFLFDDQVYDVGVNVLGINTRDTRPLGLDAHDRASDCTFASIFKPTVYDDEERAKKMLKARDMIWFVVHVLTTIGYRTDENGTTFYVEHGTAAIAEWLERNLALVTGDKVKVMRGGIGGAPAFDGQFEGAGHGCANFKASLESARNPLRNTMADISVFPGAIGKDRDHSPEDLHGRQRYNKLALKAADKLGVDLRYPFLEWRDFGALASAAIEMFNRDEGHKCEGWAKSGYTVQEWRLDDNAAWQSKDAFYALAPDKQSAVAAYLEANPQLTQSRQMTRREVFEAGRKELTLLPMWAVPQLLSHQDAPDLYKMRRVTGEGTFSFTDQDADPYGGEFLFLARVTNRDGHVIRLTEGEKYKTFLNPFDPTNLIVCQANGAYLGTCPALDPAKANDASEIGKLIHVHRELVAESQTDLARLGIERTRELAQIRMHNEGAAAGVKTERKAQIKEATSAVADLYANQ